MSDTLDVQGRVPAPILQEITELLSWARGVDALAEQLGRRYDALVSAYEGDADYLLGDRAPDGQDPEDYDDDLAEAIGLMRLTAALGGIRARLGGAGDPYGWFMEKHGFTGYGITAGASGRHAPS